MSQPTAQKYIERMARFGKHSVCADYDTNYAPAPTISGLFDTRSEAEAERERLLLNFPKAVISYWPTKEQSRLWRRQDRANARYNLTCFMVVHDFREGSRNIKGMPISPYFATRQQAKTALRALKGQYPAAYTVQWRFFYSPFRKEDVVRREELLAEIVPAPDARRNWWEVN